MKKFMKHSIGIMIIMLSASSTCFGQEYEKLERSKTLQLESESSVQKIKINVADIYNYLRIKTEGQLIGGRVLIELIDPSGSISRNFTLEAGGGKIKNARPDRIGAVNGRMQKSFRDPEKGEWMVKITPENSTGQFKIYSLQIYNPRTDLLELDQIEKDTDKHISGQL